MPTYFTHAGAKFDIEDLPLDEYAQIFEATGQHWWQIVSQHPGTNAKVAVLLAGACARQTGVELPEKLTPKVIVSLFSIEEAENIPTVYEDGIPDPKATGTGPETT